MTISLATKGVITPKSTFYQGEIEIEPQKWQMIAIPVKYGYYDIVENTIKNSTTIRAKIYNYVIQQLEAVYNTQSENLIESINTHIGDSGYYWNYIPNFTPEASEHNFPLIYVDNSREEIVPFWIKTKVDFDLILKWRL